MMSKTVCDQAIAHRGSLNSFLQSNTSHMSSFVIPVKHVKCHPCLLFFSIEPVLIWNCEILLTASVDCTVRLWTLEGHFVGAYTKCLSRHQTFQLIKVPLAASLISVGSVNCSRPEKSVRHTLEPDYNLLVQTHVARCRPCNKLKIFCP